MNKSNGDAGYWTFQALFWAGYTIFYLLFAVHYVGWTPAIIAGYMLYPCYSIGLTHLLHREFRRWRGRVLPTWKKILESILGVIAVGLLQVFLMVAIDLPFEGRNSAFLQPASLMYAALGTTSAVANWAFVYHLRYRREQRTQLRLALREAELRALESVRFEDRLRVRLAISSEAGKTPVPSMLLQTLVENALKHGIAPLPSGGDLLIRAENDHGATKIEVENTGQLGPDPGRTSEMAGEQAGVGLANTRERLRLLYGSRASLQLRNGADGRVVATVLLPANASA
jgi:hypothetical protein